ncbi:uncharacterized protein LOC135825611 [Sycon ciliatum]|uniref:uncharacterized protein LOC135825611 n=1 Tax=Sycon ciliatum TaxID=27933 RepID=UPI0031F6FD43
MVRALNRRALLHTTFLLGATSFIVMASFMTVSRRNSSLSPSLQEARQVIQRVENALPSGPAASTAAAVAPPPAGPAEKLAIRATAVSQPGHSAPVLPSYSVNPDAAAAVTAATTHPNNVIQNGAAPTGVANDDAEPPLPVEHRDMHSENHELKLRAMKRMIAEDPITVLLEKQAAAQKRYIESGQDLTERPDRAMLVLCMKQVTCYGLGDRFFGLMNNYLTAVIGGKPFFVLHNKPADLNVHMVPNTIDWRIESVKHESVRKALLDVNIRTCEPPRCANHVIELPGVPGQRVVDGAKLPNVIVYSWGNARTDVFHEAMSIAKLFPTLKPGERAWGKDDLQFWSAYISGRLWNHLFSFSDELKKSADQLLSTVFKSPQPYNFQDLMRCTPCVHARTGSGLHEVPRHSNRHDFVTCMNAVNEQVHLSKDARCKVYRDGNKTNNWIILSDSNQFVDEMTEQLKGGGTIFSTSGSGPLVHAETIPLGSDSAVRGLRRAMIDFYILSHCRYHIASLSTFDGVASIAHGPEVRRYDMEITRPCEKKPNNIGVWQRDVHAKPRFH